MNAADRAKEAARGLLVKKSILVAASAERAFRVFAQELHTWWPLATHHIGKSDAQTAIIEPFVGGRCFERGVDGTECVWGHVKAWEPGKRLVFTWEISVQWQTDPSIQTVVEVTFTPEGNQTRVELEHRHLEQYGDAAEEMAKTFGSPGGWTGILEKFAAKSAEH